MQTAVQYLHPNIVLQMQCQHRSSHTRTHAVSVFDRRQSASVCTGSQIGIFAANPGTLAFGQQDLSQGSEGEKVFLTRRH